MIKRVILAAAALSIALAPLAASAGEVDNRVNNEHSRINAGVANGQLTRREYNHVDSRLNGINAARERDLRKDGGHLTAAQYHNLNRRENSLSKSIYYDKHDLSHQPGAPRI